MHCCVLVYQLHKEGEKKKLVEIDQSNSVKNALLWIGNVLLPNRIRIRILPYTNQDKLITDKL
jgi:hypothetical protein